MPILQLFFSFNCMNDIIEYLVIYKLFAIISSRKTFWIYDIFILPDSFYYIGSNSDIKSSSFLICGNIDISRHRLNEKKAEDSETSSE